MTSAREMAELSKRYIDTETERAIEYCESFIERKIKDSATRGYRQVLINNIPKGITTFSLIAHLTKHGYMASRTRPDTIIVKW